MRDDVGAIRAFAELAEELGYNHLRVPDQVLRPKSGHLHEPLMLLAYIAAATHRIELVPSVIVLPSRQTVLVAKQMAELDHLSGGRVRMGVGVGASAEEYGFMGASFSSRGARCDEQLELLRRLWTEESVSFEGRWDRVEGAGLDPLPIQRPIPVWIGARAAPSAPVINRIGARCDGWFVLASPEDFPSIQERIALRARAAGRDPATIGTEAGVAVVGPREAEWKDRVRGWRRMGLSHLCLRTLGGDLSPEEHLAKLRQIQDEIPREG
jgi:probable F420-dependent oxidoreductase